MTEEEELPIRRHETSDGEVAAYADPWVWHPVETGWSCRVYLRTGEEEGGSPRTHRHKFVKVIANQRGFAMSTENLDLGDDDIYGASMSVLFAVLREAEHIKEHGSPPLELRESPADEEALPLPPAMEASTDLSGANLKGASLQGAKLKGENLRLADLCGADLQGADLSSADLTGAKLTCADLTCADLTDANLRGADLSGADLSDADLTGAQLTGVNLTHSIGAASPLTKP